MSQTPSMVKKHVRVVAAEIEENGKYLITQRRPVSVLPLLWEFPGGRVELGESDPDALVRELKEKTDAEIEVDELALHVTHEYDTYTLDLLVYKARIVGERPRARQVHTLAWISPSEFGNYEFPGADQQTVDALLSEMD